MAGQAIFVRAIWDAEAKVWVATSDDVPGLVTEAATIEELPGKLNGIILDLAELNGTPEIVGDMPIRIFSEQLHRLDLGAGA